MATTDVIRKIIDANSTKNGGAVGSVDQLGHKTVVSPTIVNSPVVEQIAAKYTNKYNPDNYYGN